MDRILKRSMIFIALSLMFSSCSQQSTLVIGFAGGLSASSYDLGVSGMYGAMMAVEDINEKGGVLGRKLEIIFKNDANTPEGALKVDQEFVDEGIKIIIGHMTSGVADASVRYANENGVLLVSPTIAAAHLNQLDDALIRLIPDNLTQADSIWKVFEYKQSKKIAIVLSSTNYVFAQQITDRIREASSRDIIIDTLLHQGGEEGISATSRELINQGYDGVALLLPAEQVSKYAQYFRKFDYHPTVALPAWSMTSELYRLGGVSVEGFYAVNYVDFGADSPDETLFIEQYALRYGHEATFASILSYDAVQLVVQAMNGSGSTEPEKVKREILRGRRYSGLGGVFEIDAFGDTTRAIGIFVVRDGRFEPWQP